MKTQVCFRTFFDFRFYLFFNGNPLNLYFDIECVRKETTHLFVCLRSCSMNIALLTTLKVGINRRLSWLPAYLVRAVQSYLLTFTLVTKTVSFRTQITTPVSDRAQILKI